MTAVIPDSAVRKDFEFFLDHLPEYLRKYKGMWMVIRRRKLEKVFQSETDAVNYAFRTFRVGEFIIQKCEEPEACMQTFHSPIAD